MPHHPRIECKNTPNLTTIRSRNCEIWFTQNRELESAILGNLAKCQARYNVKLYAFALEGTHKHELALFPEASRASFFRDFNCAVTRAVQRHCKNFSGGSLWSRRYSNEFVHGESDLENEFFYTVLQPVQDGLVESIDEYPGYNCFYDAVQGIERKYEVVDWTRYNSDKRWKKNIDLKRYTTVYKLKYSRLPGYENLSQNQYANLMRKKLIERTAALVEQRKALGKEFLGRKKLQQTLPGTRAKKPKISTRWSFRPRVICSCKKSAASMMRWYFEILYAYWDASYEYRIRGNKKTSFPPGTYRPPDFTCMYTKTHEDWLAAQAA